MRMLVGYDGSASADQAVALVAGLAWPAPSEFRIVVACGVQIETYAPGMVPDAATLQTIYDAKQNDAERLATAASQRIARPDLAATWEVGFNRPANTILDVADRFDPDLLVVGTFVKSGQGGARFEPLEPCAGRFEQTPDRRPLGHPTSPLACPQCFLIVTATRRRGKRPSSKSATSRISNPPARRSMSARSKKWTMKPPVSHRSSPRSTPTPKWASDVVRTVMD